MDEEKLIHIKLEYPEALLAKKDILSIEQSMINVNEIRERFNALRMDELKTKIKFYGKLRDSSQTLKNMKKTLPELKIPKILKTEFEKKAVEEKPKKEIIKHEIKQPREIPVRKISGHKSISEQIKEIQERLNSLQG